MLNESQKSAFEFLRARASDRAAFSAADLERVAGWQKSAFETYKTKHLRAYVTPAGKRGEFLVKPHFLRMTEEEFEDIVAQTRRPVAQFTRTVYDAVLEYEFLLPLTNERRLRAALDDLFYRDHLLQRAQEIGTQTLRSIVPSEPDERDDDYLARVVDRVGALLGGYSIAHVSGRFRAGPLQTHAEAAEVLARRGRYLVDETTAVVRFLLPLQTSRSPHGNEFDVTRSVAPIQAQTFDEIETARRLFISFFVENVILSIHAEDEIWFLERSHTGTRLYVLERASSAPTAKPRAVSRSTKPPAKEQLTIQLANPLDTWLRANGYAEVANDIESVVTGWREKGLKTRRNWWDILAGDKNGKPREVAGIVFPVIASIRQRKGLPPVPGALANPGEAAPPARES